MVLPEMQGAQISNKVNDNLQSSRNLNFAFEKI